MLLLTVLHSVLHYSKNVNLQHNIVSAMENWEDGAMTSSPKKPPWPPLHTQQSDNLSHESNKEKRFTTGSWSLERFFFK